MFSIRRKKPEESQENPFASALEGDVARVAVDEDGKIVFASNTFLHLSNRSIQDTKDEDFWAVIRFQDHVLEPNKVDTGIHHVFLDGHHNSFAFHFDWLETPDSKRYLIGSFASNDSIQSAQHQSAALKSTNAQALNTEDTEISQADIDNLLSLSHEIMLVLDPHGALIRTNGAFHKTFGYPKNEIGTITFTSLFDGEEHDTIIQHFVNSKTAPVDFQSRMKTKSGDLRWIEWRQHTLNGLIYCTGRDVTAIRLQEKALARRESQLQQAESLGRMGHWRWVLDEDAIEWSQEIYRIFGVDNESFEPSLMSMNHMVHRDDIDRVNQALQRAIIEENDYDMEFCITRPDGETRHIRSEGRCSRNEEGEVIALFGIMQDMTERMLYEQHLKAAKDESERAYAAKSQFLANMSHELRTPLNAIIGFSEMIERQLLGPIGTEKYLDYIGGIRESGEHLLDLISDILDMSKIEAGKYDLMLEEMNIAKTLQLAVHMMEGRALENSIKITTNASATDALSIIADRRAVLQIVLNLLSNAVKFSKENGEINVEYISREDDTILIKISDNGIGIPANKLATITRPFEQVSSSYARDHDGSGLGLAITKELAELHGGALSIESTVNVGTTVTIKLPHTATIPEENEDLN